MAKRVRFVVDVILALILIAGVLLLFNFFWFGSYTEVNFSSGYKRVTNPAKGYYSQFQSEGGDPQFEGLSDKGISVVLLTLDLKDFVDSDISKERLDELDRSFQKARSFGLSVVFRAAYGFSEEYKRKDPSDIKRILGHIDQLSPILNKHKAIILSVQAGFLGPWGEWHSTSLADSRGNIPRWVVNEIVSKLCSAVPEPISIALRRPSFVRQLDEKRVELARIAVHNDALLSSDTDMGTYQSEGYSRSDELLYLYNRQARVANGGEMPTLSDYTSPDNALEEFSKLKLTYLNNEYNKEVLSYWAQYMYSGRSFYDEVGSRLGYRIMVEKAKLPKRITDSHTFIVTVKVYNDGFSSLVQPFGAELVVIDGDNKTAYPMKFDDTALSPGNNTTLRAEVSVKLNGKNPIIGVRLPRDDEDLRSDDRYCISFSNSNIEVIDGVNVLGRYRQINLGYRLL